MPDKTRGVKEEDEDEKAHSVVEQKGRLYNTVYPKCWSCLDLDMCGLYVCALPTLVRSCHHSRVCVGGVELSAIITAEAAAFR